MDTEERQLYLQWCQSPQVELVIPLLPNDEACERIPIPRELLRRRSCKFRNLLDESAAKGEPEVIQLSDTTVETMEDFFVWTMSLKPRIEERATLHRVVRLGIFAWHYQIHALSNQIVDVIQSTVGRGEWDLDAEVVDKVYETLPAESGLRKVFREKLQKLSLATVRRNESTQERWKATFLKHAQVGWDCFNREETGYNMWATSVSRCTFHEHGQYSGNGSPLTITGSGCPYVGWECFQRGEEGMVETKVVVKEPAEKDNKWPAKAGKSKKEKKKNKARSHLKAEETPKAEPVDPPEPEFAEPAQCEEAAPCEDTTPYEEPAPCEQAAPYEEVAPCEEATSCEEAPCEEAPSEEAPCEEAPCEEAGPVNEVLTEELTVIVEGFVSEDDCSDGWVQPEDG